MDGSAPVQHTRQTSLVYRKPSLPIRILRKHSGIKDNQTLDRYDCEIQVDGEFKLVMTFDLKYDANWFANPNSPTENVMSATLNFQTDSEAFTGKHGVLYLSPSLSSSCQSYASATMLATSSHAHGFGCPW